MIKLQVKQQQQHLSERGRRFLTTATQVVLNNFFECGHLQVEGISEDLQTVRWLTRLICNTDSS